MGSSSTLRGLPSRATYPGTDWTAFTPVWSSSVAQPAIGNGTLFGRWRQDGCDILVRVIMTSGTTTTYGSGTYYFGLPNNFVAKLSDMGGVSAIDGGCMVIAAAQIHDMKPYMANSTLMTAFKEGGAAPADLGVSVPTTFTNGLAGQRIEFINVRIPIASFSAQTVVSSATQPEYVSNSSTSTTGSSLSADFATGQDGSLFRAYAASGVNSVGYRVQFQNAIQKDDLIQIEVSSDSGVTWFAHSAAEYNYARNDAGTVATGIAWAPVSSTQIDVRFYSGSTPGIAWTSYTGSQYRWRVRKVKASQLLGVQSGTATVEGIVKGAQVPGSPGTATVAAGYIGQTLTSVFSGVALTASGTPQQLTNIVLPPGEWLVTASGVLVNQGGGTLTGGNNTVFTASLSNNSNVPAFASSYSQIQNFIPNNINATGAAFHQVIPGMPFTVASNTTLFLNAQVLYSGTAPQFTGAMVAKRIG